MKEQTNFTDNEAKESKVKYEKKNAANKTLVIIIENNLSANLHIRYSKLTGKINIAHGLSIKGYEIYPTKRIRLTHKCPKCGFIFD